MKHNNSLFLRLELQRKKTTSINYCKAKKEKKLQWIPPSTFFPNMAFGLITDSPKKKSYEPRIMQFFSLSINFEEKNNKYRYSGAQNKRNNCCLNQKGLAEGESAVTPLSSFNPNKTPLDL